MLGRSRFDHVVVEFDVDRCAGGSVYRFKAIHGRLGAGRPVLNVIADILVVRADLFAVLIGERNVVAFNVNIGNVCFVAVLIVSLILVGGHLAFLCHRCKGIVKRSVQRKGVGRLPTALPVGQASVLNLMIFKGGNLLAVVMGVLCFLHPFNGLLRFYGISQHFQQVDDLHLPIGGVFQDILHPAVGLAAHIEKQVAVGNLDDVIRRRLVAVQINAAAQQHGQVGALGLVAENFLDPVVLGENGGDNAQFVGIALALLCGVLFAAAGKQANRHGQRKKDGKNFLHHTDKTSEFLKNRRKNTRAAAKPQEPIQKWIDFALVKVLFLIRKFYLESNKRQCADRLCAWQNRPAHGICKCSGDRCGSTGKPQRFQQILVDTDLMADGAVLAGAVMVGFDRKIDGRGQHDNGQHGRQQARHKTKLLCHGLSSLLFVISPCSPSRFHRGSCRLRPA